MNSRPTADGRVPTKDLYQLVIYSKDRISGSKSNVDYKVHIYPKHILYYQVLLKSVYIPFAFLNINSTYGDTLILRVTPDKTVPGTFYDLTITLTHQYASITQLISEVNAALAYEIVTQGIPIVFSFSLSGINNRLQINTSSLLSQFDFLPGSLANPVQNYIFRMLGLDPANTTTFNSFDTSGFYFALMPNTFTDDLPFGFVYIEIEEIPRYTFATDTSNTTFIVPVSHYRPYITNGASVTDNNNVTLQNWVTFDQNIIVFKTPEKFRTFHIRLTDEYHNSVAEHAGNLEWSMVLDVLGYTQ